MGRPAKKKCYWEAKKARAGELQAEAEAHKKKSLEESAKEHIGKLIDNLHIDPLRSLVIGAGAVLVYECLINDKEILKGVNVLGASVEIAGAIGTILSATFFPPALPVTLGAMAGGLGTIITSTVSEVGIEELKKLPNPQIILVCLSLVISYIMIEHGGQLIGLLAGESINGIIAIGKLLLKGL
jgi:hypothetical protein